MSNVGFFDPELRDAAWLDPETFSVAWLDRLLVEDAPVPTLDSISPESVIAGSGSLIITATGTGFTELSKVRWNAETLDTTVVSATELQATVPADHVTSPTTVAITVQTPPPGGGTSGSETFTVAAAETPVGLSRATTAFRTRAERIGP